MTARHCWRHIVVSGTALVVAAGLLVGPGSTRAVGAELSVGDHANTGVVLHDAAGVGVRTVDAVGNRELQATIVPDALERPIGVHIILPVGYRADATTPYPVLYLFPGTSGHSTDWVTAGDAVKTMAPYRLITVTSDIGFDGDGGSWFSNWVDRKTKLGPSLWEKYNVHELIPWIDANLATNATRAGRAVAGLSMGGYGATVLAARHPQLFTQMASFSGAPEIDKDLTVRAGATAIISATMTGLNGVQADAPFGDHLNDEINWEGHDPAYLINNLRGIGLWFATANGLPGKYDDPVTDPTGAAYGGTIESLTHVSTTTFHKLLLAHHIPSVVYNYGKGTHSWPYWARDLRMFMPTLMKRFDHPVPDRAHVNFTATQPRWSEFGWWVRFHRTHTLEFSALHHANRRGFRIKGGGIARIETPKLYQRHTSYVVKLAGSHKQLVRANHHGRLKITLDLGSQVGVTSVGIAPVQPSAEPHEIAPLGARREHIS